jgi:gliding motility-associated-like protein
LNIEKDSIDQLFRDNLQSASPEVPVDVMEKVLNQWQQMSSASAATGATSASMKVSQSANGWKLVSTIQNLAAVPKVFLGIGAIGLVTGLVAVLISVTDTNSVERTSQPAQESVLSHNSPINNSDPERVASTETAEEAMLNSGVVSPNRMGEGVKASSNNPSGVNKNETPVIVKTDDNGLKSSASISSSASNTPKVSADQGAINKKKEGLDAKNNVAELSVTQLEDGWVQVFIDQPATDKILLDWGDGKLETIKAAKLYRHRYLPWTKKRFTLQLVEYKDADMKVKSVIAQGVAVVSPEQQEEIIPEIITPNGDGYNDEFYVKIPSPEYFELLVFDKNNSVVFRSNSLEDHWTALTKNQQVMEGEYRILLTLKYSGETSHRFIRKRLIVQQ